jgi:acyl-CoA synthetase (NDP forming)
MRRLGMPERASVRNPVDFGAAAGSISLETRLEVVRALCACDAIGAVVLHRYGIPGFLREDSHAFARQRFQEDRAMIRSARQLQETYRKPVFLATAMTPMESQLVQEMTAEGIRFQHSLEDVSAVIAALRDYADMHGAG